MSHVEKCRACSAENAGSDHLQFCDLCGVRIDDGPIFIVEISEWNTPSPERAERSRVELCRGCRAQRISLTQIDTRSPA